MPYIHPLDPTVITDADPYFFMEKTVGTIFDRDNKEQPCTITYWLGEYKGVKEIQEVKVACPFKVYPDFELEIIQILKANHGKRIKITGEVERIEYPELIELAEQSWLVKKLIG